MAIVNTNWAAVVSDSHSSPLIYVWVCMCGKLIEKLLTTYT